MRARLMEGVIEGTRDGRWRGLEMAVAVARIRDGDGEE
jgi:hypothetical protein